ARQWVKDLEATSSDMIGIAHSAHVLGLVIRYGDVRKFDPEPLFPLVEELFVQSALSLHAAASCDNDAATKMFVAIDEMNQLALEHADRVDEALWIERLHKLSDADDRNPLLSG